MLLRCGKGLSGIGRKFDIVFSNACIQWIPDHPSLLKNMIKLLKDGGILAVQTPANENMPVHRILRELASSQRWKDKFQSPRIFYNLRPEEYAHLLSENTPSFDLWQTEYFHVMSSHEELLECYKGSGLRPYLDALKDDEKKEFEAEVFQRITEVYPKEKNGTVLFRFPRLFFLAEK